MCDVGEDEEEERWVKMGTMEAVPLFIIIICTSRVNVGVIGEEEARFDSC